MSLIDYLRNEPNVGAANLSDVLRSLHTMEPFAVTTAQKLYCGRAFPVNCYPGSIITVHKALTEAEAGDVLVVSCEGDVSGGAILGEIMARECVRRGFAGLVVDGAVRDIDGISALGFPIHAMGVTPRVGTNRRLGETGDAVVCAGQAVQPGDIIVGDQDGVVVVPHDEEAEVLKKLKALVAREAELMAQIDEGHEIADLLDMRKEFNS